jgi:hypothetical protein
VLAAQADELLDSGATNAWEQLIAVWQPRLARNATLGDRLDYLVWAPRIRRYLDECDLIYRVLAQTVLLPFKSDLVGTQMVRMHFHDDLLCLAGPIITREDADEATVIATWLQLSNETMYFRLGRLSIGGLGLIGQTPARLLNASWLNVLVNGIARYLDAPLSHLQYVVELHQHIREERQYLRIFQRTPIAASLSLAQIAQICQRAGWQIVEEHSGRARIQLPSGSVEWVESTEGVRLAHDLGYLRPHPDRMVLLQRLLDLNTELTIGKLTLSEQGLLRLMVELPAFDEPAFQSAIEFFEQYTQPLHDELV